MNDLHFLNLKNRLMPSVRKIMAVFMLAVTLASVHGSTAFAAEPIPGFAVRTTSTAADVATDFDGFEIPALPVLATYRVDMTAYTSTPEECDGNPFITADGSVVADGIVATNMLPFGTMIRIPAYFGDKAFVVHDRMNGRYFKRVDIWMNDKGAMRQWGLKKNALIEVVLMGDNKTQWDQWKGRTAELNRIGKYGIQES